MSALDAPGSRSPYIPLIRRLTQEFPKWIVWKNADAALSGSGDIDSAAPLRDWDAILATFRAWAEDVGLGPVIECRHPPKTMFLLAVDQSRRTFLELDVLGRKYFRGGTLFQADELMPLARLDPRGFRVIRPAAQAIILWLCNGLRWGGRSDSAALQRRRVVELLREDFEGLSQAARCLHLPERAVLEGAERLVNGTWDRASMLKIEGSAILRALSAPRILLSRARFRLWTKQSCPVLRTVFYSERKIPEDYNSWLREVRSRHRVFDT
ncbi:MAG TPA: hypothetical protein VGR09_09975 [Gemmatimonadales bacterium]|nr:hypothetical protein [Gemmatimonadales bacterium]